MIPRASGAPASFHVDRTRRLAAGLAAVCGAVAWHALFASTATPGSVVPSPPAAAPVEWPTMPPAPPAPLAPVPPAASSALAQWTSLKQSATLPFPAYSSFLMSHRGWPGEDGLRRSAERKIAADTPAADVIAFFRIHPPVTATGQARLALALFASGQTEAATGAGRQAWREGAFASSDEPLLSSRFATSFSTADHEARLDALLASGETASARRVLSFASPARRPVYEARLALQENAADAVSRLSAIGAEADTDPGLIVDHVSWLRKNGQNKAAWALLARPRLLSHPPANPKKWLATLLWGAQAAAADQDWISAYQIASRVTATYPPVTRIAERPLGERDDYTSLAWLAGTTALHKLNRPFDAATMFYAYARGGRSGQVVTKGYYWAGRAIQQAGKPEQAKAYFAAAAAYPELFYSQLSLERLGRNVPAPAPAAPLAISAAERAAFHQRSLVGAIRLLGQMGQSDEQSKFVRALAEGSAADKDRMLAAELAAQIGRPDLGVWLGRSARNEGSPFYVRAAYPDVPIPAAQDHLWSLAQGIIRQESSFDRAAVSHAGARGMMQLMPGTGREVAGKLGLVYEQARLTRDPDYNVRLGSHYFDTLMTYWGGNAALAAASYNAGIGNVRKWIAQNGDPRLPGADIVKWIEDIPFSETRGYVQRVLENAVVYDTMRPRGEQVTRTAHLSRYLGKPGRPG